MMTQYMMGMVQSGCWTLFDDTDRLTKGKSCDFDHVTCSFWSCDVSAGIM